MSGSFITIGSARIRKSNIKSFGFDTKTVPMRSALALFGASVFKNERLLYIQTYQGDNYEFTESDIDIDQAVEALNQI